MGRFLGLAASYGISRLALTLAVLIPAFLGASHMDIGRLEVVLVSASLAWSAGTLGLGVSTAHADFRDGREDWFRTLSVGAVTAGMFAGVTQLVAAGDMVLLAAALGFVGGAQKLSQARIRVEDDLRALISATMAMPIAFGVVLVVGLTMGSDPATVTPIALLAALGAMALFGIFVVPSRLVARESLFLPMLRFGIPIALAGFFGEAVALADRYLIDALVGTAEVGRYGVAYRLVALLNGAGAAIITWWASESLRRGHQWSHRILVKRWPLVAGAMIVIGLAAWPVISWMAAAALRESFVQVSALVGWLVAGSLAFVVATGLLAVTEADRRSGPSAWTWAVAFLVNIGLNLVLIPRFGEDGAAIATAIAYVVAMAVAIVFYRVTYASLEEPRSPEAVPPAELGEGTHEVGRGTQQPR